MMVELDRIHFPLRLASDEIARICGELGRVLAEDHSELTNPIVQVNMSGSDDPLDNRQLLVLAKGLIDERQRRSRYLPNLQFFDPVWEMLIDLFVCHLLNKCVSVSSVCIASGVPPTTALRYISDLTKRGIVERVTDQKDGRRIFLQLSGDTIEAMRQYLTAVHESRIRASP